MFSNGEKGFSARAASSEITGMGRAGINAHRDVDVARFLEGLFAKIQKEAPKWSSDIQPAYNFSASEKYARENFPEGCSEQYFKKALISKVLQTSKSGNYPMEAYGGWLLGVLANVLAERGQEGVILEGVVPDLWSALQDKGGEFVIGEFINPCILDVMRSSPARDKFLERIVDLVSDPIHDKMEICGHNILLGAHLKPDAHMGSYNLEEAKTEIAYGLFDRVGARELVRRCQHGNKIKLKISFLWSFLSRLNEKKRGEMAAEITAQVPASTLARNIVDVFTQDVHVAGSFPRSAMRFFPFFMGALTEEKQTEYGAAVLRACKTKGIVRVIDDPRHLSWMGGNEDIRGFIDAFPLAQAQEIVKHLTEEALSYNYAVPAKEYGARPDEYFEIARFGVALHDAIPEKCRGHYVGRIMDYLAQPDAPEHALVTAGLLLRGMVTADGKSHSTREIDFYPSPTYTTAEAVAHIKPKMGQNFPGIVTTGFFVGTLSEYFDVLSNPPQGVPRYQSPNAHSIGREERYRVFSSALEAAEAAAVRGDNLAPTVPTLRDFLQSRRSGQVPSV